MYNHITTNPDSIHTERLFHSIGTMMHDLDSLPYTEYAVVISLLRNMIRDNMVLTDTHRHLLAAIAVILEMHNSNTGDT